MAGDGDVVTPPALMGARMGSARDEAEIYSAAAGWRVGMRGSPSTFQVSIIAVASAAI